MAEDDSEWIVESLVGYLGSPEWVTPVTDFMENKCTVFDDEDENKLSYTEIHEQYKKLVEKLLETYMQEVGINEQQLLGACTSPFTKSKSLQPVFQPIFATDDFQIFRSLMVQKNMELQLQALRVLKEKNGALPECLTDGVDVMTELEQEEMKILEQVLKKSREEYDEEMSKRLLLEEEVGSTSSSCSDKPIKERDDAEDASSSPFQQSSTSKPTSDCGTNSVQSRVLPAVRSSVKFSGTSCPQSEEQSSSSRCAIAETNLKEAQKEVGNSEELQQRAAHLRQQRDKLHELKKDQQKNKETTTPEEALANPTPAPSTPPEISAEERKRLQKRKHLADKLKEEVIKK
uniref:Cilia- and flagella-associated protein 36 n=2 Tax=Nothobranchius korthausae TaxID=1143690 RepID=A0A1A8GQE1_9TELE